MSDLCSAMDILLGFYYEGAPKNLINKDLFEMLSSQYPDAPKDKPEVENLFKMMAANPDGEISFTEFVTTVADFYMMIST